jgi:hypothetical protein
MLPVSLDCSCFYKNNPEKLATMGTQEEEKQEQSRETGNNGYTRGRKI